MQIILPDLLKLKAIVDRFKPLSDNRIAISANSEGVLQLEIFSDFVKIETEFSGLTNPKIEDITYSERLANEFAQVTVDVRDISRVLQCSSIMPSNVVCCISEDFGIVFYVYLGDTQVNRNHAGAIHYYVARKME